MRHRFVISILTVIPMAVAAGHAGAAEIKVLAAAVVEEPIKHLADDFMRESGHKVDANFGSVGALQARIKAGEKADLIVLSASAMDELDKAGTLAAGTRTEVGRAVVGLAVRAGAPEPDISTPDAFKKTLLAARAIAYTDPGAGGTAGIFLTGLFDRLGIADNVKKKALLQTGASGIAAAVANGSAEVGITFINELLANKGVKVVGPIPQPIGLVVAYVAGVSSQSSEGVPARALISYITRPAARDRFKEAGL